MSVPAAARPEGCWGPICDTATWVGKVLSNLVLLSQELFGNVRRWSVVTMTLHVWGGMYVSYVWVCPDTVTAGASGAQGVLPHDNNVLP